MSRDLLAGLRPPPPPAALRARVLAAAHLAAPTMPSRLRETLLDRLWAARWLRLAWLGAVLVLLALHADLSGRDAAIRVPIPAYAETVEDESFDFLRPRPSQWTLAQFRNPTTVPSLGL